jgi:hypothetical protein
MDIRAADARAQYPDQNVVDPYGRLFHLFQPQASLPPALYQSFHASSTIACGQACHMANKKRK